MNTRWVLQLFSMLDDQMRHQRLLFRSNPDCLFSTQRHESPSGIWLIKKSFIFRWEIILKPSILFKRALGLIEFLLVHSDDEFFLSFSSLLKTIQNSSRKTFVMCKEFFYFVISAQTSKRKTHLLFFSFYQQKARRMNKSSMWDVLQTFFWNVFQWIRERRLAVHEPEAWIFHFSFFVTFFALRLTHSKRVDWRRKVKSFILFNIKTANAEKVNSCKLKKLTPSFLTQHQNFSGHFLPFIQNFCSNPDDQTHCII